MNPGSWAARGCEGAPGRGSFFCSKTPPVFVLLRFQGGAVSFASSLSGSPTDVSWCVFFVEDAGDREGREHPQLMKA